MTLGQELLWVRSLSDDALLLGLAHSLGASRRAVADIVVHLGEVEERRLHLLGGHSSIFAYCTARLRMSEDEAYRRIEVARLVRVFPELLEMLRAGQISLSVAALLKSRLTHANHEALLADMSGKTVAQAREVLAAWFPQPDVMPLLRKLPQRTARPAPPAADAQSSPLGTTPGAQATTNANPTDSAPATAAEPDAAVAATSTAPPTERAPISQSVPERSAPAPATPKVARPLEPLSPERYKLQLTVSADLKRKLDLARDLLRHALPSGDLTLVIERAIDLLLEQTLRRRFARKAPATPKASARKKKLPEPPAEQSSPAPAAAAAPAAAPLGSTAPATAAPAAPRNGPTTVERAEPAHAAPQPAEPEPTVTSASRHIPNATRRAVLERDGLQCTWQAPDGTRCNSQAWLEHDHIIPRGQGGTHHRTNGRILCRAHNRLAAELTYGQATITRIIAHRRRPRSRPKPNESPPKTPTPPP